MEGHGAVSSSIPRIIDLMSYAVTHERNKNSNIQGRSPNVIKVIFHKELLLKERIRSLWEQILSFKRSSHFEKDAIEENHCFIQ